MTLRSFAFAAILLAVIGTQPAAERSEPLRSPAKLPRKSIAVIAGHNKNLTLHTVDLLTEELAQQSDLKVLTSERVRAKAADYPANIQGPYTAEYFNMTVDYQKTDVRTIRKIKDELGVDYLYVVWLGEASRGVTNASTYKFLTQLFSGPSSRVVYDGIIESVAGGRITCLLSIKPPSAEKRRRELVKECAAHVRELLSELGKLGEKQQ